eukprot:scaffold8254_cov63-Phaeocystis_antarctica.AAC.1
MKGLSTWHTMLVLRIGPRQRWKALADSTTASESITNTSAPATKSLASANSLAHSTRPKLPCGSVHCTVYAHGTLTCAHRLAVSLTSSGTSSTPSREISRPSHSAADRPPLLVGTTTSWSPLEASNCDTPRSVSRSQVVFDATATLGKVAGVRATGVVVVALTLRRNRRLDSPTRTVSSVAAGRVWSAIEPSVDASCDSIGACARVRANSRMQSR